MRLVKIMANDGGYDENDLHEKDEDGLNGASSVVEVLTRIELDLAYSSEKLLSLGLFVMHAADRMSVYETLEMGSDDIDTILENAFEVSILSGFLDSEVKELDFFMDSLKKEILEARGRIVLDENIGTPLEEIEEKLHAAEQYLKQSQDQISDIRKQIAKFNGILDSAGQKTCNSASMMHLEKSLSSMDTTLEMQTIEHRRHTLQMLEKSLARELDLEKKLSDARRNEEGIRLKLHYTEQEAYFMEEELETILERSFEAENAAEVLAGIAKELAGKLQHVQFTLSDSIYRENEMREKLQQNILKLSDAESIIQELQASNMNLTTLALQESELKNALKLAEEKCAIATSEAFSLREKVSSLEEQLEQSNILLQETKASYETSLKQQNMLNAELLEMENEILDLRENFFEAESRAHSAEAKCALLTETNLELNEELGYLKSSETEKAKSLEIRLSESDAHLDYAKASVEMIEEQQTMLYSTLGDMEKVIEDLKEKVSQAEKRAENAESKCSLLTETNLEMNEEVTLLRDKLKHLESNLRQTEDAKISIANDIGFKAKVISKLVAKLTLERERLHMQISSLRKENKILAKKCWKSDDFGPVDGNGREKTFASREPSDEGVTESSMSNIKRPTSASTECKAEAVRTYSEEEEATVVESKLMPVQSVEAGQLKLKHVNVAFLIMLLAVLGAYIFQMEACPL